MAVVDVVRVAVLDANVIRYTPMPVLRALRDQGWRLRVGDIALLEVMSHIEEERDKIAKRLLALVDVLDPRERVAPTHGALIAKLGGHVEGVVAASYETWRRTRGTGLDVLARGAEVDLAAIRILSGLLAEGEADFSEHMDLARKISAQGVTDPTVIMRRYAAARPLAIHVPGGAQERFHLYFSLLALHPARAILAERLDAAGAAPRFDPNSAHDTNLAQHLAEGVFVATADYRYIADDVDATGSFQAPWVRSPWELIQVPLPAGPPWGRGAKRARDVHRRRTREGLRELERLASSSRAADDAVDRREGPST